jgi:hypothetical protein
MLLIGGLVLAGGVAIYVLRSSKGKRQANLGAVRVQGTRGKPGFSVRVGEDEVECFRSRWPASGLGGLRNVFASFEPNGDLVELECNRRYGSCDRWDGSALSAMVADMQCAGEAKLGIVDRCVDPDAEWRKCMVVKVKKR